MDVQRYRDLCQKNQEENYFLDKYIFRKISIYFTILFIRLHVQANQATFLSLMAALGSCYFLLFNSPVMMGTAALLIFVYYLLDHVDGELARYYLAVGLRQPSLQGKYFDVLVHKYSTNLMLFSLGISVYRLYGYGFAILLGFAAWVGMSAFPNLMASQVVLQKVARDRSLIFDPYMGEILYLLEKKREQVSRLKDERMSVKLKKIATELLFFPGALLSIILVVLADIYIGEFLLFSYAVNLRLLFLLFVTPLYLANTIRQIGKWLKKFANM